MNILISAIADDIGFGAGRILRDWKWRGGLYGIALDDSHPGSLIFDSYSVAPPADDPSYLAWIKGYFVAQEIDIFLPTSEAEISLFSAKEMTKCNETRILINNPRATNLALDKFECMAFLAQRGVAVPKNGLVGASDPEGYPVVLKPRFGRGGQDVREVSSRLEFKNQALPGEVWQEYLLPDAEEYTCAVFRSGNREVRTLLLRRTLSNGSTASGEVVSNYEIEHYVKDIAQALDVEGSINVQLRLTNRGPLLFEINPRLSSTLVFRDKMGFCDLRWWLADVLGSENTPQLARFEEPVAGTRFFKGPAEYILNTKNQNRKLI